MNVAVLMDPLIGLNPKKDTTLALIRSAIELGHEVKIFTPPDWYYKANEVRAKVCSIALPDDERQIWQASAIQEDVALSAFDVVLMRQDPPMDSQYLYATYALELVERCGVIVSNSPSGVRDMNEKFAITAFPAFISPTLITQDIQNLHDFWREHQNVVFKPLDAFGGAGVCHVDEAGQNMAVILDLLTDKGTKSIMAQRYIPDIKKTGDKRILMIHGEPAPYALARIPAKEDWRGNLAAGATGQVIPLNETDKAICAAVSPVLKEKGLHFVGLDVIGAYLTEINVTSATCLCEIEREKDLGLAKQYWHGLMQLGAA